MAEPELREIVAAELAEPVDPRVTAMAAALAAEYPGAARAVLFYGSCLRQSELDGLMLDFYLIVSDYREAYRKKRLIVANTLIPPNVFPFAHEGLIAKYAVLSEADFHRLNGPEAGDISIWARFAQPSRLVWAADPRARARVIEAVARAAPTLFVTTLRLHPFGHDHPMQTPLSSLPDDLDFWRFAFSMTYGAELRAERQDRSGSVVDADPERYHRFTRPVLATLSESAVLASGDARRRWSKYRFKGKSLTLLRLAKATTTFAGGVDYIAWKINRHAGTGIVVKPWMRRWPILGALTLLPRLWRRGAIR